jgi:hypothetical protein
MQTVTGASTDSARADLFGACPALETIEQFLHGGTACWLRSTRIMPDRKWQRVPYDRPVALTPWDTATNAPAGPSRRVTGRDVSLGGFSFAHMEPLACREAVVTFGVEPSQRGSLLLRLNWCRFTRAGIYLSGGRFLEPVATPLDADAAFDELPHL